MKKFFILFCLFLLTQGVKIEDKEETCFVLSTRGVMTREGEWRKILKANPSVTEQTLRNVLVEDTFNYCMQNINPEEVKKFSGTQNRRYETFAYLVDVPYEKYFDAANIKKNSKFEDKKVEIAKRVAIKSLERPNHL